LNALGLASVICGLMLNIIDISARYFKIRSHFKKLKVTPEDHIRILNEINQLKPYNFQFLITKAFLIQNKEWPGTNNLQMKYFYLSILSFMLKAFPAQSLKDPETIEQFLLHSNLSHVFGNSGQNSNYISLSYPDIKAFLDPFAKGVSKNKFKPDAINAILKTIGEHENHEELLNHYQSILKKK
jgi:hypothetical protein